MARSACLQTSTEPRLAWQCSARPAHAEGDKGRGPQATDTRTARRGNGGGRGRWASIARDWHASRSVGPAPERPAGANQTFRQSSRLQPVGADEAMRASGLGRSPLVRAIPRAAIAKLDRMATPRLSGERRTSQRVAAQASGNATVDSARRDAHLSNYWRDSARICASMSRCRVFIFFPQVIGRAWVRLCSPNFIFREFLCCHRSHPPLAVRVFARTCSARKLVQRYELRSLLSKKLPAHLQGQGDS